MADPSLEQLAPWLAARERLVSDLKPGNAARLHLQTPDRPRRTRLSLVYLHGFSAGPGESADAPERLADALHANAFVARLPGHGREGVEAMRGIVAEDWLASAREALSIGARLGGRVVLAGTSMGASLAFALAAEQPDSVAAVLAWSLGARPRRPQDLDLACTRTGVLHDPRPRSEAQQRYWSASVHSDGHRALRALFRDCMTPATAARVRAPFFLAYHYADAQQQDATASVEAMLELFSCLGTDPARKRASAFADAAHAVASPWRSAAAGQVLSESRRFVEDMLGSG